ncbi:MAG: right-handed parallel beta-helix repeat-containing protein [Planctomycetaceae bacterium]
MSSAALAKIRQRTVRTAHAPFGGFKRRGAVCLTLAVMLLASVPPVFSQNSDPDDDIFKPVSDGSGIQARVQYLAFPTFGRSTSITNVELFPYLLEDNQMFFGNGRLFVSNYGNVGGNIGLGYRMRPWGAGNIFGASLWYDGDDTVGRFYQQLGLSLEQYSDLFDVRLNGYLPVGQTDRQIADRLINPRFVGNQLLFDRLQVFGVALAGVDYEIGMPLPATVLRQHNLRVYVGGYNFGGNGAPPINGAKARIEGSIIPSLDAQALFTTDRFFGTNVMLGVSWAYFGGFKRTETSRALRYDRMGEWVYRNYNVIVGRRKETTVGVTAINPNTQLPYVIQHVGAGISASGTVDSPWATVAAAQTAGADVILVHAGAVLNEPIVLQSGQVLIGQGNGSQDWLNIQGYGSVLLPQIGAAGVAPIIQGVSGNAVTMANNSVISGFVINSPTGNGIYASGVHDFAINNVQVNNAGGNGVYIQNASGNSLMSGMLIKDAAGAGLRIDGGTANMWYDGRIESSTGRSLLITNTTDGTINMSGSTIAEDGGDGIRLANNDGDVILDNVTVRNSSGIGVEIDGGSGQVTMLNTTTITNAAGTGLSVQNRDGNTLINIASIKGATGRTAVDIEHNDGETWFNRLHAESTNAPALYARDSERLTIATGDLSTTGGAAFDAEDTKLNALLTSVAASGGAYGIRIVGGDGVFALANSAVLGSAGLIQHAGVGVYIKDFATVGLAGLDLKQNGIGLQADNVKQLALTNLRVTDSTSFGLKLLNVDEFHSINSQYLNNGSLDATIVYEVDKAGSRVFNMNTNTIESNTGDAIRVSGLAGSEGSTLNFSFQGNSIKTHANFVTAVGLDWSGILLANAVNNGIQTTGDHDVGYGFTTHGIGLAQISVGNNVMLMDGNANTALLVNTGGPSELVVGGNKIAFNSTGTTGLDLTLAKSANVSILSNQIIDVAGGGTGILFNALNGPSSIEMELNTLDFRGPGALIDRGIIFQSITDTVTLQGVKANNVLNATTPFFIPAGTTQGHFNVNGQNVP